MALLGFLAISFNTQAELVNNGSFDGDVANGFDVATTVDRRKSGEGLPSGWSLVTSGAIYNTPDTLNATTNSGGILGEVSAGFRATPDTTTDQGTWVGIGRHIDKSGSQNEQFGQTITGFIDGQEYTVSWLEGNFGVDVSVSGSELYNSANRVVATLGSTTLDSGDIIGIGSDWYTRTFSFTASATSHDLSFEIAGPASSYLSIDDVSIVAVSAVPEPQTWALMAAGLMLLGLQSRKRQA